MFKLKRTLFLTLHLALWPSLALAQSSGFDNAYTPRGSEARLSFTIPIGESSKTYKTAPRLELGLRRYSQQPLAATDWMLNDRPNFTEARLGFTLSDAPNFLLNNQVLVLSAQDEQANVGTAGKIGIGVGAVVLVGVVLVAVILISCPGNLDGCGED